MAAVMCGNRALDLEMGATKTRKVKAARVGNTKLRMGTRCDRDTSAGCMVHIKISTIYQSCQTTVPPLLPQAASDTKSTNDIGRQFPSHDRFRATLRRSAYFIFGQIEGRSVENIASRWNSVGTALLINLS